MLGYKSLMSLFINSLAYYRCSVEGYRQLLNKKAGLDDWLVIIYLGVCVYLSYGAVD